MFYLCEFEIVYNNIYDYFRDFVSCHPRETGTKNADLVLQAARKTAVSHE